MASSKTSELLAFFFLFFSSLSINPFRFSFQAFALVFLRHSVIPDPWLFLPFFFSYHVYFIGFIQVILSFLFLLAALLSEAGLDSKEKCGFLLLLNLNGFPRRVLGL